MKLSFCHKQTFSNPYISLQLDVVNLWYFKLRLFDLTKLMIWNIKGLRHRVAKIKRLQRVCGKGSSYFIQVRLAQLAEKKRREEEEGKYEVGKVLEVKFPKGKPREFLIRWKGHGEEMDSWEPENNLDCSDLIQRSVSIFNY